MRRLKPFKPKVSRTAKGNFSYVLRETLPIMIPFLRTEQEAHKLESDLYEARRGGLLDDAEYVKYSNQIKEVCKKNNWAMP